MKRYLMVLVLAAMVLLIAAPAADAKRNYRPWKAALETAWNDYYNYYWYVPASQSGGMAAPLDFDPSVNRWDWDTQVMATLVTALYGVPNSECNMAMRRFLRPFRRHGELPTPWIAELLHL